MEVPADVDGSGPGLVTHFVNVTSALLWFLPSAGEAVLAGRA